MTYWPLLPVIAAGASLLAVIFDLLVLLSRGKPIVYAELADCDKFVDLLIRDLGQGIAHNVRIHVEQFPDAALQRFRESRYFKDCIPSIAPDQLVRVRKMISLRGEFWAGKGLEHSQPLILDIRHQIRGFLLRWTTKKRVELPVGIHADLVQAGHSPVAVVGNW